MTDKNLQQQEAEKMNITESDNGIDNTANNAEKVVFPKRLIALMAIYVITSVSGLMAQQGVLLCVLTLMLVLGVAGRQEAALYMLRAYAILQLALYSVLPVIMYDPDNIVAGPTTVDFGFMQMVLPDWVIFSVLIALALVQVWISFNKAVFKWFKPRMNFNIIS